MNKKKIIVCCIILAVLSAVVIYIKVDQHKKEQQQKMIVEKNKRIIKEKQEEAIKKAKSRLEKKYNIKSEDLEVVECKEEHSEGRGVGVWFDKTDVNVPYYVKMKYKDKTITVFGDRDDFYYDDFVDALNNYYKEKLNCNLLVVYENPNIATYFKNNDISEVNKTVVEDFIKKNQKDIRILIEEKNQVDSKYIENFIDKINNCIDIPVVFQIMTDISEIKTYREKPNHYYFDYYYFDNIDYQKYRVARIDYKDSANYTKYNNYFYSL